MKIGPGKPNNDGSVPLEFPEGARIEVRPVREPSLAANEADPFAQFKVEEDKYYYRGLNIRPQNMRVRKAEGYEVIPETEFGDLVLGRIPKEEHDRRIQKEEQKTKRMMKAVKEQFKQEAAQLGVKTFEE